MFGSLLGRGRPAAAGGAIEADPGADAFALDGEQRSARGDRNAPCLFKFKQGTGADAQALAGGQEDRPI